MGGGRGTLHKKSIMLKKLISKFLPVTCIAEGGDKERWFLLFKKTTRMFP